MPDRARVEAFIEEVVHGDHVKAIRDYYHPHASMQENRGEPRRGRDLLMQTEAEALRRFRMRTHPAGAVLVDGDHVVIQWTFDMTDAKGVTRRLEELTLQRWEGDRIAEERFYYDPVATRQPLDEPGGD
ncbi:MAG: nuclear transport factor 2 family protein [Pseudomonadota bacterium]|nr:nuclear transport factor 2 family protein [Pseudomonadota bacterium]